MSICKLMIMGYQHGVGRLDPELLELRYSDRDLEKGIIFAEGLIEEGYLTAPFYNYSLKDFIVWAKQTLDKEVENE